MRFLADESVEASIVEVLREEGHDVLYISETAPGVRDERVLQQATAERCVLLTNDKDFATLAFLQRLASAGIVLMRMPRARSHAPRATIYSARSRATVPACAPQ